MESILSAGYSDGNICPGVTRSCLTTSNIDLSLKLTDQGKLEIPLFIEICDMRID